MSDYPTTISTDTRGSAPTLQIRVIGPIAFAQAVLADRADLVRTILGPHYQYRMQTRTARKAGQVRVYLTITRKENKIDEHHDG
jgi:hypothetical protein